MKKQKLKLGLNRVNVSKLNSINGGNGSNVVTCVETVSRNFLDICCGNFFAATTDDAPLSGVTCDQASAYADCTEGTCHVGCQYD